MSIPFAQANWRRRGISAIQEPGFLLSYYLFGDYRGRELAVRVPTRVCLHDRINPWGTRDLWPGKILIRPWPGEVTGEEKYLRRAGELVQAALAWKKRTGDRLSPAISSTRPEFSFGRASLSITIEAKRPGGPCRDKIRR